MKIWLRSYPVLCPTTLGVQEWVGCCLNDNGTVNVGDDTSGFVVSIQPDGRFDTRPNGTAGPWEQCAKDGSLNVVTYSGTGTVYKVPYRAR